MTAITAVDAARLVLVAAMVVLMAGVVALGYRGDRRDQVCRRLPWWTLASVAGYVSYAVIGQAQRLEQDTLSWRFWLLAASTATGLASVGTVLWWKHTRR